MRQRPHAFLEYHTGGVFFPYDMPDKDDMPDKASRCHQDDAEMCHSRRLASCRVYFHSLESAPRLTGPRTYAGQLQFEGFHEFNLLRTEHVKGESQGVIMQVKVLPVKGMARVTKHCSTSFLS